MILLDLFCGAGGAAVGYHKAGFEVIGVDINPQPKYPFEFIQGDALEVDFSRFDAVHASPPCQRWSSASGRSDRYSLYPDSLRKTREFLKEKQVPYVIENVQGAPLISPVILCGTIFAELRVIRHRLFECSFPCPQPPLDCSNHPLVYSHKYKERGIDPFKGYITVAGGGNTPVKAAQDAMGIDWMPMKDLSQAIPPVYTEYIGKFLKAYIA